MVENAGTAILGLKPSSTKMQTPDQPFQPRLPLIAVGDRRLLLVRDTPLAALNQTPD